MVKYLFKSVAVLFRSDIFIQLTFIYVSSVLTRYVIITTFCFCLFTGIGSWGACQHYYRPPEGSVSKKLHFIPEAKEPPIKPFKAPSIYVKIAHFHRWIKSHEDQPKTVVDESESSDEDVSVH